MSTDPPLPDHLAEWLSAPGAPIAGYVRGLLGQIERLTVERTALLAPVEGVDVEEVLRLDREGTAGPWHEQRGSVRVDLPGGIRYEWAIAAYPRDVALITHYRTAAPVLAREVARLRAQAERLKTRLDVLETERNEARDERDEAGADLAAEQARHARLIRPAIASAHLTAGDRRAPLWSLVANLFAVGSTRAESLCHAHGYDPDQEVARRRGPKPAADKATP